MRLHACSALLVFFGCLSSGSANAEIALCRFDPHDLLFAGTIPQQTRCLLRKVKPQGAGSTVQPIPAFLETRVGAPVEIDADELDAYLDRNGIGRAEIGGSPHDPLSQATGLDGVTRPALYFVIHDTSAPEFAQSSGFPGNIDTGHSANRVGPGFWTAVSKRVNTIVSRTGASHTFVDFGANRSLPGVKLEQSNFAGHAKGRFLHVENIQPRLKPSGTWAHIAPDPGFTDAQLTRLALMYAAASVRSGTWLVPAFHFNIDHEIAPNVHAHDDPQNFDLALWVGKIEAVANTVSATGAARPAPLPTSPINEISCASAPFTAVLNRGKPVSVPLPANGTLFGEGHYVTTQDGPYSTGNYPKPMSPQPAGYPPPVQCNEAIDAHLERSLQLYRQYDAAATRARLYTDKWASWWTPQEGGACGQGSVGDHQLKELTPEWEMWFFTMNWVPDEKPARGTRFLISANDRHVVAISGYETGPGGADKLGGVTREVHGWLGTNNSSDVTVAYLADQDTPAGPAVCRDE